MITLTVSLTVFAVCFVLPIVAGVHIRRYGIQGPWKLRIGIVALLWGFMASCGSAISPRHYDDQAAAMGALTGLLTPFVIADVLLFKAAKPKPIVLAANAKK